MGKGKTTKKGGVFLWVEVGNTYKIVLRKTLLMGNASLIILYYIQSVVILISFLFSLKLIKNRSIPKYMYRFYWYNIVAILVTLFFLLQLHFFGKLNLALGLNNISVLFHFTFLSFFVIKVIPNHNKKALLFLKLIYFVIVFFTIKFFINTNITKQINAAFSIINLGLFIFTLTYYFQLLNTTPKFNLLSEPSFWVITGIFFSSALLFPVSTALDYLPVNSIKNNLFIINLALSIPCILFHLFLIKAFICSIKTAKT